MSISPGADRVDLIAAINDGHLPPPGLVTRLVNQAYDRFKIDDSGTVAGNFSITAGKPVDVELGRGLSREQRSGLTKE